METEKNIPIASTRIEDLPVPYMEINAEGVITYANPLAALMYQRNVEEVIGSRIWDHTPSNEAQFHREAYLKVIQSGEEPPVIRRSFWNNSNRYRVHEVRRNLIRDDSGRVLGMRCVYLDVTDSMAEREEVGSKLLWLESVLDSLIDGVLVTDALGFVRYMNHAAEELTGWTHWELVGKQIEKGMPILSYKTETGQPLSFRMTLDRPWSGSAVIVTRVKGNVRVFLSASPILDKQNGHTTGVASVFHEWRTIERHDEPTA